MGWSAFTGSITPTLRRLEGRVLTSVEWHAAASQRPTPDRAVDLLVLQRSARWISDANLQQRYFQEHAALAALMTDWQAGKGIMVDLGFSPAPWKPC